MALDYRTGLAYVFPPYLYADRAIAAMLTEVGIAQEASANKILQFRDPRTVFSAMLAGPSVMEPLIDAGIATTPLDPDGTAQGDKGKFLAEHLKPLAERYAAGQIEPQTMRTEIANLFKFMRECMRGVETGSDGKPLNHQWALRVKQPVEAFDMDACAASFRSETGTSEVDAMPQAPRTPPRKRSFLGRLFG